jgi:transcription termination/antitermination protein NusG
MDPEQPHWYAVYTRSRHEKQVAEFLERQQIATYLPLRRQWSSRKDRKLTIQVPALPGYLFVNCTLYAETRALIKRASGVLRLVEHAGRPATIPVRQIESLRAALDHTFNAEGHPYLKVGDRVRVTRGPMLGAEGYLVRVAENRHRLVIAVDYVNQALSVEIHAGDVEPVE